MEYMKNTKNCLKLSKNRDIEKVEEIMNIHLQGNIDRLEDKVHNELSHYFI